MVEVEERTVHITEYDDNEVIRLFKQDILDGKNWYLALLEAIGRWNTSEETVEGRTYRYLIAGEAFDWLLLAERLCLTADHLIPENEKERLLFHGKAPLNLAPDEFQLLIGENKYKQYLNFFYGIAVEEALFLSVQDEVRKEKMISIFHKNIDCENETYLRIYNEEKRSLLKQFRKARDYPLADQIYLPEMREFTYWLFKYRLEHCERSRVASDTRKAMEYLKEQYVMILKKTES